MGSTINQLIFAEINIAFQIQSDFAGNNFRDQPYNNDPGCVV